LIVFAPASAIVVLTITRAGRSTARFIIVVEKDAVFQRLAEDRIFDTLPSIVITASTSPLRYRVRIQALTLPPCVSEGYPDLATRMLLKRLHEELRLPVVGLFDWNPGGIGVYMTYRYGSINTGIESYAHSAPSTPLCHVAALILSRSFNPNSSLPAVDIKWLGLCWEDIKRMNLPQRCYQPHTDHDVRKIRSIQESGCLKVNRKPYALVVSTSN
jgi:meiotic recombination protein SPO11